MCLTIHSFTRPKAQVAKEDIRVYKVIKKNGLGIYYTPSYRGKLIPWKKGFHYTEKGFGRSMCRDSFFQNIWEIHGNAFHSSKHRNLAENMVSGTNGRRVIVMYIPKGALFYENEYEYASSELVWY